MAGDFYSVVTLALTVLVPVYLVYLAVITLRNPGGVRDQFEDRLGPPAGLVVLLFLFFLIGTSGMSVLLALFGTCILGAALFMLIYAP